MDVAEDVIAQKPTKVAIRELDCALVGRRDRKNKGSRTSSGQGVATACVVGTAAIRLEITEIADVLHVPKLI